MIRYATYDPDTGAIIRTGHCQASDVALQAPCVVSDEADAQTHYVAGGQLALLPSQPSPAHRWHGAALGWVDPRSLAELQAAKWTAIKAQRDARLAGTFTHGGNTYDMDPVNLAGAAVDAREALIAGEAGWTQTWVLADNSTTTLTAAEMIALGRAAKAAVSDLWATSQYLRGLIDAATTTAEVAAVAWP